MPLNGRKLRTFFLDGAVCFQSRLSKLNRSVKGLTIDQNSKDIAHCIRFVQRKDLQFYNGSDDWNIEQDLW